MQRATIAKAAARDLILWSGRVFLHPRRVPFLLDGDHVVQNQCRSLQRRAYPVLVQRSAHAQALPVSVPRRPCSRRWLLNSLVIGICVVAITLVTALPAAYSLARMTGRNGEALGIGIFLTYLVPPTLLFLPLSRVIADSGLAEFDVVAGAGLPDLHHPVLHLAVDGVLQVHAARDRGSGDRRRLQPVRRLYQDGAPAVAAGDPDGGDLHVHFDLAGIRLRADLHIVVRRRSRSRSAWRPISFAAISSIGARSWPARFIASIPVAIAYNFFLDNFIAGITGGAVK